MSAASSSRPGGRWTRLTRAVAASLLVAGLSACGEGAWQQLSGPPLDWQQQRGQWVFINYWAEWCRPCRKEIPELNRFAEQHKGQALVLGVNFDAPAEAALAQQTRAMNIEFPQLLADPAGQLGYDRPTVLPATYVFDPDGRYRGVMVGPQTEASLLAWLQPSTEVKAGGAATENRAPANREPPVEP